MTDEYGRKHTDGSRSGGQPVDDSIKEKALALVNEVREERHYPLQATIYREADAEVEALCRALEQLEAFKQEVSDAAGQPLLRQINCLCGRTHSLRFNALDRFIIPKAKPDPLVEIMEDYGWYGSPTAADNLRAALEARGLEIRSKNDDRVY
jgi:hypothetical protein